MRQKKKRRKVSPPPRPSQASNNVGGFLEPRLVHGLHRRRVEGQIAAVRLRVGHEDGDQVAARGDDLVDHVGAAEADAFARQELRDGSVRLQQRRDVDGVTPAPTPISTRRCPAARKARVGLGLPEDTSVGQSVRYTRGVIVLWAAGRCAHWLGDRSLSRGVAAVSVRSVRVWFLSAAKGHARHSRRRRGRELFNSQPVRPGCALRRRSSWPTGRHLTRHVQILAATRS